MDRITQSLVNELVESEEITHLADDEQFEYFCNYCIVNNEYSKTFELDVISVGSGSDTGIDGIAIIVNGHLIENIDDIDDLLEHNGYLEITYLFIQAKTSSTFNTADMRTFSDGVEDFFEENPTLPRNEDIENAVEISNYLVSKASKFKENPKCKLYYITTGQYNDDDQNITSVQTRTVTRLEQTNLFSNVEFNVFGANEIGKYYRKSKNPISSDFVFSNKVTLENIDGIKQAYYGLLPFSEFKKILINDNDVINSIFDDNVRDFQGSNNPVNSNIDETLSDEPKLFSILNNGITVVANSLSASGNLFTISDYQIVNGCQTSNVLYEHKNNELIEDLPIPLKLIVTDDEDVKSKITVSTNNQTAIKKEQLTAMSDFQKNLERYYNSIEGEGKLYYERRSKQYNSDSSIVKRRIITVSVQIKSFAAMFLQNPHLVTSYFGTLTKNIGKTGSRIFEENHQFAPYYLAALAYYRLDTLFTTGTIDTKYKKVRFFILMLFMRLVSETRFNNYESQRLAERFSEPIIAILNDANQYRGFFETAISIIADSGVDIDDKQFLKSKAMTDSLVEEFEKQNNGEEV